MKDSTLLQHPKSCGILWLQCGQHEYYQTAGGCSTPCMSGSSESHYLAAAGLPCSLFAELWDGALLGRADI